jgi:Flp pilus assembly protein TadG
MRSRYLRRDQSGLAAVEFALIFPIMLLLFLGSFETTNLVLAYMKLEASAETAADLVGAMARSW